MYSSILTFINRTVFSFSLLILVILLIIPSSLNEKMTLADGTEYTQHLHEGDLELYNVVSFIPLTFMFIFSFLELKNKNIKYLFLLISIISLGVWYIIRIYLQHPDYDPNYFSFIR